MYMYIAVIVPIAHSVFRRGNRVADVRVVSGWQGVALWIMGYVYT